MDILQSKSKKIKDLIDHRVVELRYFAGYMITFELFLSSWKLLKVFCLSIGVLDGNMFLVTWTNRFYLHSLKTMNTYEVYMCRMI